MRIPAACYCFRLRVPPDRDPMLSGPRSTRSPRETKRFAAVRRAESCATLSSIASYSFVQPYTSPTTNTVSPPASVRAVVQNPAEKQAACRPIGLPLATVAGRSTAYFPDNIATERAAWGGMALARPGCHSSRSWMPGGLVAGQPLMRGLPALICLGVLLGHKPFRFQIRAMKPGVPK